MWHHVLWPIPFHRISSQAGLGSDIILPHALILNLMASPPYSYTDMYGTQQALPLSENLEEQYIPSGDPSSVSYIPRAARSVPHAHTVHTIHVKKITYPLTSRLPELCVLETNQDGLETWRSIETFLGNLQLSQDPRVIRAMANQWRIHYEVQPISTSSPSESLNPVLPHPEHSNVQFGQPVSVFPDHTFILQSCWGRSAYHHSQVPPTSLYWPPSRTTPPTSPSRLLLRHSAPTHGSGIFVISPWTSSIWPE